MSSTFGSFETAKSGLSVSMQQLNVTEQNITNVNTDGYTRQRILTSAKEPSASTYLIATLNKAMIGQGVETTGIQQIRSSYLDQQYRTLNTNYSYSSTRNDGLTYLDGVLNELNDDSSLTTAIANFSSALNSFSQDTSNESYRTNVQQQAQGMTESFQNVYEEMQSLWKDQNSSVDTIANEINSLAQKIASLNDSIAKSQQTAGTANDLNDERNLLLDQLSGYVNITYAPNAANGNMLDVKIGGISLVDGKVANSIAVDTMANHQATVDNLLNTIVTNNVDPVANAPAISAAITQLKSYGNFNIAQSDPADPTSKWVVKLGGQTLVTGTETVPPGTATMTAEDAAVIDTGAWAAYNSNNLTMMSGATPLGALSIGSGTVTGGQLYGNMEMMTSQSAGSPGIPYYMDQLNTLVRSIAKGINDIHQTGFTYPNGATASTDDVIFFNATPVLDASGNPVKVGGYTQYDYSKLNAGNFDLSAAVKQSIFNIAGSSTKVDLSLTSPQTGNNEVASQLLNNITNNGYNDTLNSLTDSLSVASDTNKSLMSTKKSLVDSVDTQRKSTSAVSLDEETTNLIVFQQSYNAAARVITTLNDMLNTLVNTMGAISG